MHGRHEVNIDGQRATYSRANRVLIRKTAIRTKSRRPSTDFMLGHPQPVALLIQVALGAVGHKWMLPESIKRFPNISLNL